MQKTCLIRFSSFEDMSDYVTGLLFTHIISLVHNRTHDFLIVRFLVSFQFFGIAYVVISS